MAQTALGGAASFLILEAVGATLLVQYGFTNAALAILATGLIIFLAGWPISLYAARHGVDMDLLTRGAGFGYIGSTITSLIYASFTFIFLTGWTPVGKVTITTTPDDLPSQPTGIGRTTLSSPYCLAMLFPPSSTHSSTGACLALMAADSVCAS